MFLNSKFLEIFPPKLYLRISISYSLYFSILYILQAKINAFETLKFKTPKKCANFLLKRNKFGFLKYKYCWVFCLIYAQILFDCSFLLQHLSLHLRISAKVIIYPQPIYLLLTTPPTITEKILDFRSLQSPDCANQSVGLRISAEFIKCSIFVGRLNLCPTLLQRRWRQLHQRDERKTVAGTLALQER